jgi:hypothetical protein
MSRGCCLRQIEAPGDAHRRSGRWRSSGENRRSSVRSDASRSPLVDGASMGSGGGGVVHRRL